MPLWVSQSFTAPFPLTETRCRLSGLKSIVELDVVAAAKVRIFWPVALSQSVTALS